MDIWEDSLLERKVESDLGDLLKTVVAFANSVRPGHVATILIGERDDGSIQGVTNPDQIQQRVRRECERVYPAVIWRSQVYTAESKPCVRVEIEFSGDTPHFGGPAWIRRGSETVKASDELFQQLISVRSGLVREVAQWIGKTVSVYGELSTVPDKNITVSGRPFPLYSHRWAIDAKADVISVNSFWVTLRTDAGKQLSEPLDKVTLSYDDENSRLKLIIKY